MSSDIFGGNLHSTYILEVVQGDFIAKELVLVAGLERLEL